MMAGQKVYFYRGLTVLEAIVENVAYDPEARIFVALVYVYKTDEYTAVPTTGLHKRRPNDA